MLRQYFLLFVPAMVANVIPPIASKIFPYFLNIPIDLGKTLKGKRIFGDHKTLRGYFFGLLFAQLSYELMISRGCLDGISDLYGFMIGFSALAGDSVKSFFKRQLGYDSGKTWFPFDQIDWIIGFLVCLSLFIKLDIKMITFYILFGLIAHLVSKVVGKLLGINKTYI